MQSLNVEISVDLFCLNSHLFKGLIYYESLLCGEIKVSEAELIPQSSSSLKRSIKPAVFTSPKRSSPPKIAPKTSIKLEPKGQPVIPDIGNEPKLNASDMIKIMQDFETKKKTYCCIVCKYETVHSTTIKRHVEMKHMPQTVSLNCLQCTKTFNLRQHLKTHYMKTHGLVDQAAKAMLP